MTETLGSKPLYLKIRIERMNEPIAESQDSIGLNRGCLLDLQLAKSCMYILKMAKRLEHLLVADDLGQLEV